MIETSDGKAGIATAIIGNILLNVALNFQRRARRRLIGYALHGFHHQGSYGDGRDHMWWIGLALLISGECTVLIAYGLAPASIVSPLGVFAVISNCVIPPLLFDEAPHANVVTGTLLALPGLLLLILSAPEPCEELPQLDDTTVHFLVGMMCLAVALTISRAATRRRECWRWLISNCALSALIGSFSVLAFKRLAAAVASGRDDAEFGGNGGCAAILATTALLQFVILYDVLRTYPLYQVVPQHFACFSFFVSVGSGVVFHEFRAFTNVSAIEYAAGLTLALTGVFIASKPVSNSELDPTRASPISSEPDDAETATEVPAEHYDPQPVDEYTPLIDSPRPPTHGHGHGHRHSSGGGHGRRHQRSLRELYNHPHPN